MPTGQVSCPDLAMITSFPFLSWSVLLRGIFNFTSLSQKVMSQGRALISSLKRRKPENANRHAAVNQTFDNVGFLFVSPTIALSMSTVMGSFLLTGLAKALLRPSNVVFTSGLPAGEGTLAKLWAHVME